ncbi:MAG: PQQ-binding-like beta-propeller repeat protein [Firmicutes bacterium]|nr:PQQ-binding-like beta-propeller repeat protein [Bacillota bacterium]
MFLGSPFHTGYAGSPPVEKTEAAFVDTGAPVMGSPAFVGNRVFITSMNGYLFCINMEKTPSVVWKCRIGHKAVTTPAADGDGNIYAGSQDKYFYKVSSSGKVVGKFLTEGPIASSACILSDNNIVFSSMDGNVYCLNPDLALQWKFPINHKDLEIMSSPAADRQDNIYIGSDDGNIYSLDKSGKLRWKFSAGDAVVSSPLYDGEDGIYAGCVNGSFFCLSTEGKLKWKFTAQGSVESSPVMTKDNLIVFGSRDGNIYAFDTAGNLKWKYHADGEIDASASSDNEGGVYAATEEGWVFAISAKGEIRWKIKPGGSVFSSPAAYKGKCVIGSEDGKVYFTGR